MRLLVPPLLLLLVLAEGKSCIHRQRVVQAFNPRRNASSTSTPLQVGNGNFAFGVDVTGLQTFNPFGTLSTWGWHNFSLPTAANQTSTDDFTGMDWWTHERLVNYDQPNPAEPEISNWLIQNPQRVNLGSIGLSFGGEHVDASQLEQNDQVLDMWSGKITSTFVYKESRVTVETSAAPDSDSVGISVESDLLSNGALGVVFDFPYADRNKFDAPFVGVWNATSNHSTSLEALSRNQAVIKHTLDQNSYYLTVQWEGKGSVSRLTSESHRYGLSVSGSNKVKLVATFSPFKQTKIHASYNALTRASQKWWQAYWTLGAFIDLTSVGSADATELQRRIIQSQYLMAVNSASSLPPQESGLVNTGWYGKFHLEMFLWHSAHWARWNHFDILSRSLPATYQDFLQSSYERARLQGYKGARWGKMTDPTGRSAPGEINSLLIWQQPHPVYFAELEYRSFPNAATLEKWDEVLTATADFMASYAFYNQSTGVYDLGPPIYPVSENGNPNATTNPTFELAYWRFGLDIALKWKQRQGQPAPTEWVTVRDKLAPLPIVNGTYVIYEGVPHMWIDNETTYDHPAMAGIYGWLPPPMSGPALNLSAVRNTADKIRELWALEDSYGWDFSLLAMNQLRLGDAGQAVAYLLHPAFQFDDAGYPAGGSRVATPYFPNAASFLLAMAMMAGGWDGSPGPRFPDGWDVRVEGFVPGL